MDSLQERLDQLRAKLARQQRVLDHLDFDIERPLQFAQTDSPDYAITLVGKGLERLLKQMWLYFQVEGDPASRTIAQLMRPLREHVQGGPVLEAFEEIQRGRNRAAHDGYEVTYADALAVIERFSVVLEWFSIECADLWNTGAIEMNPQVQARIEFVEGLQSAMGFTLASRFDLSPETSYLVFQQQTGRRVTYLEVILSVSLRELRHVWAETAGTLMATSYPKSTRFVLIDDEPDDEGFSEPYTILRYQAFLDTFVDSTRMAKHAAMCLGRTEAMGAAKDPLSGDVLVIDRRTLLYHTRHFEDLQPFFEGGEFSNGNTLIIGGAGAGKSVLLLRMAGAPVADGRYRFFIDLSDRQPGEEFVDMVVRQLAPVFKVPSHRVWPVFHFLVTRGHSVCLLDGIDEAVTGGSLEEVAELFGDIAELMSEDSTTVLTARQSFLLESPYVRQLLHRDALVSERVSANLVNKGVDVLSLPDFAVVRLTGVTGDQRSPLVRELEASTNLPGAELVELVAERVTGACRDASMSLDELVTALGRDCLEGAAIFPAPLSAERLPALLLTTPGGRNRFRHKVFGEYLAACAYWASLDDPSLDGTPVSDQTREFINHIAARDGHEPAFRGGNILVGPPGSVRICHVAGGFTLDRTVVTAGEYRRFLDAFESTNPPLLHPLMPAGETVEPFWERLVVPDLYVNPDNWGLPATAINWWGAWAYARWAGGRLPSSLEWEAAARGHDGRLFSWGDETLPAMANCADLGAGRLLASWEEWRAAYLGGLIGAPRARRADEALNTSPSGCVNMCGNVWEWTETCLADTPAAVIAGGSYDNPLVGVGVSSRAAYRLSGRSNAVGFRVLHAGEGLSVGRLA